MYIRPIADLIKNFPNIHYHIFADFILLFTFFLYIFIILLFPELIECSNYMKLWLLSDNQLTNSSYTTVLNISTSDNYFPNFTIYNIIIYPSHSYKKTMISI